jgi:hypothetical protein
MTTLDDDVLAAARVLARQRRQPMAQPATSSAQAQRNGLPLLPLQPGGAPVDLELVNQRRDETPCRGSWAIPLA